jgi:hypothetical protein
MCLVTRAGDAATDPCAHPAGMFVATRCVAAMFALVACSQAHAENGSGAGVYRDPAAWELFAEGMPLGFDDLAHYDSREFGGDADGVAARVELRALTGLGLRALTLESKCSGMQSPHEGHSRGHVELAEYLAHLRLDGVHRDTATGGDLRERPALAELLRDVEFGAAEFRHGSHGAVVPRPAPGRHLHICTNAAQRPLIVSR